MSTLNLPISPSRKKPSLSRRAITNAQRIALRTWFRDPVNGKLTQANAIEWWNRSYGYPLSSSSVSEILSIRYQYLDVGEEVAQLKSLQPSRKRERSAKWEVLEAALFEWEQRYQTVHGTVTGDLLRMKATELWGKLPQYSGLDCPTWSEGWLGKFKERHDIKRRKKTGESGDADLGEDSLEQMRKIRERVKEYSPEDIYNMDETGFHWKKLPDRGLTTLSGGGKKVDKTRITANLCCNSNGTDKLPIWFIGEAAKPRCFAAAKIKNLESLGSFWRHNATAWMENGIMKEWLRWFDNRAGRKVLLLMDNFSAHEMAVEYFGREEEGDENKFERLRWTTVVWLPANSTSVFQPLDQGIIQNWKCYVKREFLRFLMAEFDAGRDIKKTHHVLRAVRWGIDAWEEGVTSTVIQNCWIRSHVLIGERVGQKKEKRKESAWDDCEELLGGIRRDIAELQRLGRIVEAMDSRSFINPVEEVIADEDHDIIDHIVARFGLEKEAESEEEVEEVQQVTASEAFTALQTLKLYKEQQEQVDQRFMKSLRAEERELQVKRTSAQRQTTLFEAFGNQAEQTAYELQAQLRQEGSGSQ